MITENIWLLFLWFVPLSTEIKTFASVNKQHLLPKIDYVPDYISLNVAEAL